MIFIPRLQWIFNDRMAKGAICFDLIKPDNLAAGTNFFGRLLQGSNYYSLANYPFNNFTFGRSSTTEKQREGDYFPLV